MIIRTSNAKVQYGSADAVTTLQYYDLLLKGFGFCAEVLKTLRLSQSPVSVCFSFQRHRVFVFDVFKIFIVQSQPDSYFILDCKR